jgi:hypothetical protein
VQAAQRVPSKLSITQHDAVYLRSYALQPVAIVSRWLLLFAVTVAVSRWCCSHRQRSAQRRDRALSCPGPNPTAAEPDGRRVLSRRLRWPPPLRRFPRRALA